MSQQGIQKAAQLLNALGQQLPAIAQASETEGVDVAAFTRGLLTRVGVPADCTAFVDEFVRIVAS